MTRHIAELSVGQTGKPGYRVLTREAFKDLEVTPQQAAEELMRRQPLFGADGIMENSYHGIVVRTAARSPDCSPSRSSFLTRDFTGRYWLDVAVIAAVMLSLIMVPAMAIYALLKLAGF